MRQWISLGRLSAIGSPVSVHWSVLLIIAVLVLYAVGSPAYAALAIVSYLAMIAIHELGHALVARRLGCEVLEIRIAVLHGQCIYEQADRGWDRALIAWGGVAAQLCVAVPVLIFASVMGNRDLAYLGPIVAFLGYVNLLVALVNLAPSPGLDGADAWRIVPLFLRRLRKPKRAERGTISSMKRRK